MQRPRRRRRRADDRDERPERPARPRRRRRRARAAPGWRRRRRPAAHRYATLGPEAGQVRGGIRRRPVDVSTTDRLVRDRRARRAAPGSAPSARPWSADGAIGSRRADPAATKSCAAIVARDPCAGRQARPASVTRGEHVPDRHGEAVGRAIDERRSPRVRFSAALGGVGHRTDTSYTRRRLALPYDPEFRALPDSTAARPGW